MTPIYTLKEISLTFGVRPLFTSVSLNISRGDKICLVGRNGSGKSTLLKIISGTIDPDGGSIFIQPGIKIAYMAQEEDFSLYHTLKDVVLSGLEEKDRASQSYKADILMEALEINATVNPQTASGGERKKAALARALISEPDILLLDEPTNHLDITTIEKLEEIIKKFSGAVVVISHDRSFLTRVSNATLWLDRGIIHQTDRGFASFEAWQDEILNQEIIKEKYLNKKIEEETEWLHKGVTARRRRNQGRLRRLKQLRQDRKEQIKKLGSVDLEIKEAAIRSKLILEAKHINKSFGSREIIKDFSLRMMKGNRIGIVGSNGSGKTTLLKLLTAHLKPDSGFVRIGKNLEMVYFDQNRETLDPEKTLWKTLCGEGDHIWVRGHYRHVIAYLKDFLFTPEQAQSPVSCLSGGEKNRLMLALSLAKESNFLVLDEPTNDLDMDTLDLLLEVLDEYEGTILLVSHDRDFLNKITTSMLYLKGDGSVIEHVGNYEELYEKYVKSGQKTDRKTPDAPKKEPVKEPEKQSGKSPRLSYKDQRLYEVLPNEISAIEKEIQTIEQTLSDPALFTADTDKFYALTEKLQSLQILKDEKETKWLEIEMQISMM
ncbi:MAG: ABC-F family ATP-binding cassette domain-containing protein [Alphaproteobacteria bacterium]|nr:ABC-F family ATP-binding cassette domain-containing protein [Alphaproteobacteria bacterium]